MERLLPQNIDAECGVLGSLIIDPDAYQQIATILRPIHFYRDAHRIMYQAIIDLHEGHQPADFITVGDELEKRGKLEFVGGMSYITSLVNRVPTSGNIEYYARIVERAAILRLLISAAGEIAAAAYEEDEDALDKAEQLIHAIRQGQFHSRIVSHREALTEYMEQLDALHEQKGKGVLSGIPTPFPLLNGMLGGYRASKLYVLAARPGIGKTAFALNCGRKAVKSGCNVLFFSLEMDREELMQRWISMEAKVDSMKLRDGTVGDLEDEHGRTEWDRVMQAEEKVRALKNQLFIDDTPSNTNTAMASTARAIQSEHGLDLIIVDYLQLATVGGDRKLENRRLEVEEVSRSMKALARELKVPVLALAQLNRASEERADRLPQLHDLREAGGIEQDCDVAMFIHKPAEVPEDATEFEANLLIQKHRNGPKGIVPLYYVGKFTQFYPFQKKVQQ